ncbi:unnamed protein product [Arabidopsis lyrata]|uniref:Predicted protein n=1 Tax=Arabidopsis lyrata subsp. lyrata TaxID=81972 RepID=D7LZG8_ARALL|nr:predicted protein [Arabidopsis lyrata subsp. lyrata]CAH8272936.1 unnamed protein product [Arabidopsis lyrata]
MRGLWWKVIATLSLLSISISLYRLCPSTCSLQYASIGGTTLYVVMLLMLHFPTTIRIYKEHEPPLPGTRVLVSVILVTAIYYITFNYPTWDVLVYTYSMFVFGVSMFQLNSPMQLRHVQWTLFVGLYIGCFGRAFGDICTTQYSCPLVASFFWIYLHAKVLSIINGFFI